jgi:hypothetical protein
LQIAGTGCASSRGHVKISSEVGRGTSVRIYLPRTAAERPADVASEHAEEPRGTESVLLVEDDACPSPSSCARWAIASSRPPTVLRRSASWRLAPSPSI